MAGVVARNHRDCTLILWHSVVGVVDFTGTGQVGVVALHHRDWILMLVALFSATKHLLVYFKGIDTWSFDS